MNKTLLKNKNKIVGGNKFTFDILEYNEQIISFTAERNNDKINLTFFLKKNNDLLKLQASDIKINTNLKIITSNITTANYYELDPKIEEDIDEDKKQKIVDKMNKFDTCLIVDFNKISYIFLNVNTSANKSIKNFEDEHTKLNLKRLDALMMIRFKQLGLDINFVNKFIAAVKGYVDGQKKEQTVADGKESNDFEGGGKKMSNYKILNNLILKLNKINNIKKLTKPKAVKPTKPKAVKPTKPKATKPVKPKATKPVKPTKPKATKPKATKSKAIKKI